MSPADAMPIHQSYPYDATLFPRRPSMLRLVGEAIISWADSREAARTRRRFHGAVEHLPDHLRRDIGLDPLGPYHLDRW